MVARRRVARQHEDWLNLVDVEAPWFSLPVLKRVLPNGLWPTPPEIRAEHKARWYGADDLESARLAEDRADYLDWILRDVLDWGADYATGSDLPPVFVAGITRHDVTISPTGVYQPPASQPVGLFDEPDETEWSDFSTNDRPLVLVFVVPVGTDPRNRPVGDTWPATWVQRAALSCRHHEVPLALVTDGDHLTLVHAPKGGATGWGTWRASEFATEPVLLDSLRSLLHNRRFTGMEEKDTPKALLVESASSQAEVTNQLGTQVRRATELLVNAISRANRDRGGTLLDGVGPHEVYEAAVTVMMRTVFLLVAEENELLPIDDPHYQKLYSIRTLRELLEDERLENPEALETRTAAWHRLLATSRAVHSGVHHDEFSVPAYGGNLFDPDRFAFLEGRTADGTWHTTTGTPIPVTDLDVLAILDALLVLRFSSDGGVTDTRRLSYRHVDVEQIGHIYERLLDHDAVVAEHVVLGLKGKTGEEPEISLPDLEAKKIDGDKTLIDWLTNKDAEKAGRRVGTKKQIEKLVAATVVSHLRAGLIQACQGDQSLVARIEPFANLLRLDLRDRPLVFLEGSVYVTETGARRDSGTAYTTKELADEVAEHALAPLCYSPGPQDTADTNQWRIRSSAEILELKVCDPAVGSGAILVAACRYLANRLIEAWRAEADPRAAETVTAADDPNRLDVVVEARRLTAEHCCYGVDRNPMAVEMAKLSMWLTTVAKGRPFTFLDHALKSGDSLLGIWHFDQLRYLHYDVAVGRARETPIPGFLPGGDALVAVEKLVAEALDMRREMHSIETIRPSDVERKQKLHRASEARIEILSTIADVLTGAALSSAEERDPSTALTKRIEVDSGVILRLVGMLETPEEASAVVAARNLADARLNAGQVDLGPPRQPFHWPIAFPEVFEEERRFDLLIGNPPFKRGNGIRRSFGGDYRAHLVVHVAAGRRASADLVSYFFRMGLEVGKAIAFLAINSVSQADSRAVALDPFIEAGWTIYRASTDRPWPGGGPSVSIVWATRSWRAGEVWLRSRLIGSISSSLDDGDLWSPRQLAENADVAFQGVVMVGAGFLIEPSTAKRLIRADPRNRDVLMPFLNGADAYRTAESRASRWAVNFYSWSEEKAREYSGPFQIVEAEVKPQRQRRDGYGNYVLAEPQPQRWWQYHAKSPAMHAATQELERVLVIAVSSRLLLPVFVTSKQVLAHKLAVVARDDYATFGALSSTFHVRWAWRQIKPGVSPTYSPRDHFRTFARPLSSERVARNGEELEVFRSALMQRLGIGMTALYRKFHASSERGADYLELRDLHVQLDNAMRDAYGWSDLELDHDFHEVRGQGTRFTFSPGAADEAHRRLSILNKKRYEAEVAAGMHKSAMKAKVRKAKSANQVSLLGDNE